MPLRISSDASAPKRTTNLPVSTAVTIAGWFNFASVPARFWGALGITAAVDGSNFMQVSSAASGSAQLQLIWVASGLSNAVNLVSVIAGKWYFLALTCSGTASGAVAAYSRSVEQNALTSVVSNSTRDALTTGALEWGRDSFTGDFIDGSAQHCILFDRALDARELLLLSYDLLRERVTNRTNLNAYYRLRSNTDIYDLSPNRRDPTVTVGANAQGVRLWPRRRGALSAPGGGSTYNESVSEAGTASQSLLSVLTALNTLGEAAAGGDSLAHSGVLGNALSEAGSAGDSASAGFVTTDGVVESGSAADSLANALTALNTLSESGTAAAAQETNGTYTAAVSDSGAAADALLDSVPGSISSDSDWIVRLRRLGVR
jgi:hypothetical protein